MAENIDQYKNRAGSDWRGFSTMKKLSFLLFLVPSLSIAAGNVTFNSSAGGGNLTITSSSGGSSGDVILSTMTAGATNFVFSNSNSLQTGSTFYVSSGTVEGQLKVNGSVRIQSFLTNGIFGTSGSATFYGADGNPTIYVNDEESGIGVDAGFGQNVTIYSGLSPILTVASDSANLQDGYSLKFRDSDDSNFVAFRSSSVLSQNHTYVLPSSPGTANKALLTDGRDNLYFSTVAVSASSPLTLNSTTGNLTLTNPLPIANGGTNNTSAYSNRSIIFSNGTLLTQDNTTLNFDSTTDNMGIGTTNSSSAILQLSASSSSEANINLSKGSNPTSPTDGDLWFTSATNSFTTFSTDLVSPMASVVLVSTGNVTVSNTASEIYISSFTLGTKTIPANGLTAGKLIRINAQGYLNTSESAGPTLKFKIYIGTTAVGDTGSFTLGTGLTNAYFSLEFVGTLRTVGTGGKFIGQGKISHYDGTSMVTYPIVNTTGVNINTMVNNDITVTATWGSADSSNILTVTNYWWEYGY